MTTSQPSAPPAPPSPEEAAQLQAENAGLAARVANQALRDAAAGRSAQQAARDGAMGVVKGADGVIVVTGRDGRTIRIDPKVVTDEDQVQQMVQTALEPPRPPELPRRGPSDGVQIVGIIFSTLLLLLLGFPLVRSYVRRTAAGASPAGAPPELAQRLARIEQAIEAVAIEVERISESERYSARLLTERLPAAAAQTAQATPTADAVR